MIKLNFNLPFKKRLHIQVSKRRQNSTDTTLFPRLEEVRRVKKGSKISRYFRHVFEYKKIKRLLGTNIAFAIIATTLLPNQAGVINVEAVQTVTAESPIVLPTQSEAQFPVKEVRTTQGFRLFHPGIDLDGVTGDPIRPILGGNVEAVDRSRYAYGNAVYINHGNGLTSLYAHLSKILVKEGEEITQETVVGLMGATGNAHGDHLHLEIKKGGIPVNPLTILPH